MSTNPDLVSPPAPRPFRNGRVRGGPHPNRDAMLRVRVTTPEREWIFDQAEEAGLSPADFVRHQLALIDELGRPTLSKQLLGSTGPAPPPT